jgi:hypothetical protein
VTDPDNPFAVTLLLDRAVDIVSAAADGQRLRAAAMIAASRINPVPATRTADPAMAAIEEEYRRRLDDLETPRTPVPNGSGEDIEEIPLGECGSVTAEIDENGPTTGDVRAFRIRCDLRGIAMGRTIAVISTPDGLPLRADGSLDARLALGMAGRVGALLTGAVDAISANPACIWQIDAGTSPWRAVGVGPVHDEADHLPRVAAALVAEGLRRAGLPDEFALRLNVVTVLQPFGPPIIRLRFPLDVASIDLPVLTREARETLAPMTRPTLRVKIDGGFDEGLVVRELSLPPEPVDRSVEPMQALRATRVLAGLDVPAEIITENAVSVLRHLSRTRP